MAAAGAWPSPRMKSALHWEVIFRLSCLSLSKVAWGMGGSTQGERHFDRLSDLNFKVAAVGTTGIAGEPSAPRGNWVPPLPASIPGWGECREWSGTIPACLRGGPTSM